MNYNIISHHTSVLLHTCVHVVSSGSISRHGLCFFLLIYLFLLFMACCTFWSLNVSVWLNTAWWLKSKRAESANYFHLSSPTRPLSKQSTAGVSQRKAFLFLALHLTSRTQSFIWIVSPWWSCKCQSKFCKLPEICGLFWEQCSRRKAWKVTAIYLD